MEGAFEHAAPGSQDVSAHVSPSTSSAVTARSSRRSTSRRKPHARGSSPSSSEGATQAAQTISQLLQQDTSGTGMRTLPPDALTTVTSLVGGLPDEVVPLIVARSTARRGKGGRQPGLDPFLDPSVDPARAKRILANRQSAARSKLKQKVMAEKLRIEQELAAQRQRVAEKEIADLKRKVVALEAENQQLEAVAVAVLSPGTCASPGACGRGDASGGPAAAAAAAAGDGAGRGGGGGMSTSEGSCGVPCQVSRPRRARKAPRHMIKVEPQEQAPDHPMPDATHTSCSANLLLLAAQGLPPPAFAQGMVPFAGDTAGQDHHMAEDGFSEQQPAQQQPPTSPHITSCGASAAPTSPRLLASPPQQAYVAAPGSSGLLQLSPPQLPAAQLHRLDSWWSSGSTLDAGVLQQAADGENAAWCGAAEAAAAAAAQEAYAALAVAAQATASAAAAGTHGQPVATEVQPPAALPACSPFKHGSWHNMTLPLSVGAVGPSPAAAAAVAVVRDAPGALPGLAGGAGGLWQAEEDAEERCLVDIPPGLRSLSASQPMGWGSDGVSGGQGGSSSLPGQVMCLWDY